VNGEWLLTHKLLLYLITRKKKWGASYSWDLSYCRDDCAKLETLNMR